MEDTYKPRFTNDLVAEQYRAIGQVNIPKNLATNGGDEPSGDAEAARLGKQNVANATLPSPTHTREELVEVMCKSYNRDMTAREALAASLDALIAIGAVRVK